MKEREEEEEEGATRVFSFLFSFFFFCYYYYYYFVLNDIATKPQCHSIYLYIELSIMKPAEIAFRHPPEA